MESEEHRSEIQEACLSVKVIALIWDHFPEGGGAMLTAHALADKASHDGSEIYPAVATVAAMTRQSERSVQYHLRAMEESGWLVRVESGGGRRNTTTYRIPVERIPQAVRGTVQILHRLDEPPKVDEIDKLAKQIEASVPHETVQSATTNGATGDTKGCNLEQERVQPIAPEPSLTVKEPSLTVVPPAAKKPRPSAAVISFDFDSKEFSGITATDKASWAKAYPAINVDVELAKAAAWLDANPANLKSNFKRFLVNWFSRSQDKAPRVATAAPVAKPADGGCQYVDRPGAEICGLRPALPSPHLNGKPACEHHHNKLKPKLSRDALDQHLANVKKAARQSSGTEGNPPTR